MAFDFEQIIKGLRAGLRSARQQAKSAKEKAVWVWEALQGDFNPNRSVGQVGLDTAVCLIPGVDTVMDVRDLIANIIAIVRTPTSGMAWFSLVLTLVGFIPELGSIAKGIVKIVFIKLRPLIRHVDDLTNASKMVKYVDEAFDAALPDIITYLRAPQVQKFLTTTRIPDIIRLCSKAVRGTAERVNPQELAKQFNEKVESVRSIVTALEPFLPAAAGQKIKMLYNGMTYVPKELSRRISSYMEPMRAVMLHIAKRLDDMYWIAWSQQVNKGWIAPLSEQGARRLVAKHRPHWIKSGKPPYQNPQFKKAKFITATDFESEVARGAPSLSPKEIASFANIFARPVKARALRDGEKLYRVIDPTSGTWGGCWITEDVWKKIIGTPDPRVTWRSKLAVKPEWNQNGQYITYTHNAARDGTVKVWEGPTAMQALGGDDYLEGGFDQIVMHPWESVRNMKGDNLVEDINFPDMVEGSTLPKPGKIRVSPTDSRIDGPHPTGWGFKDFVDQHELIGLPNPNR